MIRKFFEKIRPFIVALVRGIRLLVVSLKKIPPKRLPYIFVGLILLFVIIRIVFPSKASISISAVGDCTLGTDIYCVKEHCFTEVYDQVGDPSYFFKNVKEHLAEDDLTIVNFEGTLSENGERQAKQFAFRGKPEYVKILTEGSVEAANLSNNHAMDYGEEALADTKQILSDNGIVCFEGKNFEIRKINGIKTALIGVGFSRDEDEQFFELLKEVKKHRPKLIILSVHWGIEKSSKPTAEQIEFAHSAIDNGVDLILGHHPHVVQGIEKYNDRYIVYSLGNFCFGGNIHPAETDTMIYKQTFKFSNGKIVPEDDVSVIPCSVTSNSSRNNFQPKVLENGEFDRVKEKIINRSSIFTGIENVKFVK